MRAATDLAVRECNACMRIEQHWCDVFIELAYNVKAQTNYFASCTTPKS